MQKTSLAEAQKLVDSLHKVGIASQPGSTEQGPWTDAQTRLWREIEQIQVATRSAAQLIGWPLPIPPLPPRSAQSVAPQSVAPAITGPIGGYWLQKDHEPPEYVPDLIKGCARSEGLMEEDHHEEEVIQGPPRQERRQTRRRRGSEADDEDGDNGGRRAKRPRKNPIHALSDRCQELVQELTSPARMLHHARRLMEAEKKHRAAGGNPGTSDAASTAPLQSWLEEIVKITRDIDRAERDGLLAEYASYVHHFALFQAMEARRPADSQVYVGRDLDAVAEASGWTRGQLDRYIRRGKKIWYAAGGHSGRLPYLPLSPREGSTVRVKTHILDNNINDLREMHKYLVKTTDEFERLLCNRGKEMERIIIYGGAFLNGQGLEEMLSNELDYETMTNEELSRLIRRHCSHRCDCH